MCGICELAELESDVRVDPIMAAMTVDVRAGESWTRLGGDQICEVYLLGPQRLDEPGRGMVTVRNFPDGTRRCTRVDGFGKVWAVIVGQRVNDPERWD